MWNALRYAIPLSVAILLLSAFAARAEGDTLAELEALAGGGQPATAALQRLIDESTGLVDIPAGTFLLDAPLHVDLPVLGYRSIRGAAGATRLVMASAGPALKIIGNHEGTAQPGTVQDHTWERERLPIVSDLEILGKHEEADGIELYRTMKCIVRNVLVRQCRYGIHLVERNRNVIIADSHLYDCLDTGLFLDTCNLHQINILGNHISYCKRAGIRQLNGDVHNVQITGNDIEYNFGSAESSGEIVLESSDCLISEYTITSNTIQARPENPGANILMTGDLTNTPCSARVIAITGNVIGDRDKNIVMSGAYRATITGNTIYGGKTLNIQFQSCENVVLSGNTIGTRPATHASAEVHDDGLLLENCTDCLVSGNIMSEHRYGTAEQGGAVTLINCLRCRVSGCEIVHPKFRGVHIVGGMGCVVSDNSITAPATEDFRAAVQVSGAGQAHLVQNNWISSALDAPILIEEANGESKNNTLVPGASAETVPAANETPISK